MALLIYGAVESGLPPWSAYPFLGLMATPLLFPLSSDPMEKIPAERLGLWPLGRRDRIVLRAVSVTLSPIFWLLAIYAVKTGTGVAALLVVVIAVAVTARVPQLKAARRVPMARGRWGGLVTAHVRGMLSVLDTWVAILLAVLGWVWRAMGSVRDPEALPILAMLIALTLSTQAQALFGLDYGPGETLLRILPLRGWEILVAKDVAWLGVLVVLVAPLDLGAGMTFGLAALATGHHASVGMRLAQKRWRFAGGRLWPVGLVQILVSGGLGFAEMRRGSGALLAAGVLYCASVWWYGPRTAVSGPHSRPD